jgi:hypothetical protein
MSKAIDKIEKEYQLICGAMSISADSVCRRRLTDYHDSVLDRLTEEIHPEYIKPQNMKGEKPQEDKKKSLKEKKQKMLENGKLRLEVRKELKSYEEQMLEGNSKLLQDTTGEIQKR